MLYALAITLTRSQKRAIILGMDILTIGLSYILAQLLIMGPEALTKFNASMAVELGAAALVGAGLICWMGVHKIKLNAYQMRGVIGSGIVALSLVLVSSFLAMAAPSDTSAFPVFAVFGMLFLILTVASRLLMRQLLLEIYRRGNQRIPILIYGAGQTGQQLATALTTDETVYPVAFVDDNQRLHGLTIAGLRVYAPADIEYLISRNNVGRIVLAMPSASRRIQMNIIRGLEQYNLGVHMVPTFTEMIARSGSSRLDLNPINVNDLLGRDDLESELPGVSDTYHNRNVLVTGAGGSIGSELCRQILSFKPTSLTVLDHSELLLFQIDRELRGINPDIEIHTVLGSVCNSGLVQDVMTRRNVDIVLHAAAYKHVPLVEDNVLEGIENNVLGTKTVAEAARVTGVERFILVSTDKAVRPSSVMGASKRFAELVIQDLATRSTTTRFSMVRFGNVLGSSGSVIPLFQEQIARGGPITLTHSDVTRYFMTIPEAVRLVLLAGSFARGGDVFVLDMGKPVPIRKLAEQLIETSGYSVRDEDNPEGDIEIEITGLRPGEKLHEELLIGSDMLTTPHPRILRAQEKHLSEIEMAKAVQALRQAIETRSEELLYATLDKWIETASDIEVATVNE